MTTKRLMAKAGKNTLKFPQTFSFASAFCARGMTQEDADSFISGNDSVIYDMLVHGRKRTSSQWHPEEYTLRETCDGRYCGVEEAHVYFGTRLTQVGFSGLKNHCATLKSQLDMMEQERREKILTIWIPSLSLQDMCNVLPRGYFPKHTRWYQDLMQESASHQKMETGFRLFQPSETVVEDGLCLSLTECVYLYVIFHLAGEKFLYHKAVRCMHGQSNSINNNQRRCTFRGWSEDPNDHLGFDISENYKFEEERKPATHFTCNRYLMTP